MDFNEFVKPVTLHVEMQTDVTRIKNHIIDNPGVTVRQIVDAVGVPAQQVRNAVFRLNAQGVIRRSAPRDDEKRVRWEEGPDEDYERRQNEFGRPKQTIVSTWEPEKRRDYMTAALFGPAENRRKSEEE